MLFALSIHLLDLLTLCVAWVDLLLTRCSNRGCSSTTSMCRNTSYPSFGYRSLAGENGRVSAVDQRRNRGGESNESEEVAV